MYHPSLFFHDPLTTNTHTLSLHDALPIWCDRATEISGEAGAHRDHEGQTHADCVRAPRQLERSRNDFREHDGGGEEVRSEEHTSELQSRENLVCRLLLEKKNK